MASYQQLVAERDAAIKLSNEADKASLSTRAFATFIVSNTDNDIHKATALIYAGIAGYNAMRAANAAATARNRVGAARFYLNNNFQ